MAHSFHRYVALQMAVHRNICLRCRPFSAIDVRQHYIRAFRWRSHGLFICIVVLLRDHIPIGMLLLATPTHSWAFSHTRATRTTSQPQPSRCGGPNEYSHPLCTVYLVTVSAAVMQTIFSTPADGIITSTAHMPYEFVQRKTVYWAVFIYQTLSLYCLVLWTGFDDSFSIAWINTICGHCADFKARLKTLNIEGNQAGTDRDAGFYKDLVKCCTQYEDCLRCALRSNNIFIWLSKDCDDWFVYLTQLRRCDEFSGVAGIFRSIWCQRTGVLFVGVSALCGSIIVPIQTDYCLVPKCTCLSCHCRSVPWMKLSNLPL